jgi:hypothetical protein
MYKFNCTRQLHESIRNIADVQVRVSNPQRIVFVKNQFKMLKLNLS